jgi:hypothetical protein
MKTAKELFIEVVTVFEENQYNYHDTDKGIELIRAYGEQVKEECAKMCSEVAAPWDIQTAIRALRLP